MGVARHGRIRPDVQARAIRPDARERERDRDIEVRRKAFGGFARRAAEHPQRLAQPLDADVVLEQVGRAGEAVRRLAGRHLHRVNLALRGGANCIEPEQRAARHDDLSAVLARQLDQRRPRKESDDAQDHELLSGRQHRPGDLVHERGRRAFDDQVGRRSELADVHDWHGPSHAIERCARLRPVARRHGAQRDPGNAVVQQSARNFAADRAKTRQRHLHESYLRPALILSSMADPGHKSFSPSVLNAAS